MSNPFFTAPTYPPALSRVRSADIKAVGDATNVAFDLVNTQISLSDGAASIVYGTNWVPSVGQVNLKKDLIGRVILDLVMVASGGAPGTPYFTLPVGYRPAGIVSAVIGIATVAGIYYPCSFNIQVDGTCFSGITIPSNTAPAIAASSAVALHVSFTTV